MGSVRAWKIVKYLTKAGYDIRVVTAGNQSIAPSLPLDIPASSIASTTWLNINRPIELALGGRRRIATQGYAYHGRFQNPIKHLGALYKYALNVPDAQIGWYPFAIRAASRLIKQWRPHIIYASASPFTALLVGSSLSRYFEIPWVAEFRDLWTDNHYLAPPSWRKTIDAWLEQRTLPSARGFVTVSEPLAEKLRRRWRQPIAVILNGFDPEDYPDEPRVPFRSGKIKIVYTGMIYEGKQDPSPLFEALRQLGPLAKKVDVEFYGRYTQHLSGLLRHSDIASQVRLCGPVSYQESLRLQSEADILLLLLWNDDREQGVYTGKLFEYIGACRPILALGPRMNVAAELILERKAGMVASNPTLIANQLRDWLRQKQDRKEISALTQTVNQDLSRQAQVLHLDRFITSVLDCTRSR